MPDGFDTVVMQEDVRIEEQSGRTWVMIPPGLKPGANRRLAGEDAKIGRPAGRDRCALAAARRGERRRVWAGPASLLRPGEGRHLSLPATRSCAQEIHSCRARSMTPMRRCWRV